MPTLHPLRFEPVFRRYIWGGRRLATVLSKPIGEGDDYAESWEVVDHGDDQSVVAHGPLAGQTLHALATQHGEELFGRHAPQSHFPLLFKLLDCNRNLSVQVHPNDEQAARLDPPDLGKTEAWVILDAEPGSVIYAGLKRGFDRDALAREVQVGTTELCLHKIEPRPGDCIFIPAGTVHALGSGLLVAEIQQASDTTYRLFDWNRVGPDGRPRQLHVEQSLAVIDYNRGPVKPQTPQASGNPGVERLVECEKFILDRRTLTGDAIVGGDERFHILCMISGEMHIEGDRSERPLSLGETALLPAAAGMTNLNAADEAVVLDMYLP